MNTNEAPNFPGTEISVSSPGVSQIHVSHFPEGFLDASLDNPISVKTGVRAVDIIATSALNGAMVYALPDRMNPRDHSDVSAYGKMLKEAENQAYLQRISDRNRGQQVAGAAEKDAQELKIARIKFENNPNKEQYEKVIDNLETDNLSKYYETEDAIRGALVPALEGSRVKLVEGYVLPDGRYVTLINRANGAWFDERLKIPKTLDKHVLIIGSPFENEPLAVAKQHGTARVIQYRGSGTYFSGGDFTVSGNNGENLEVSLDVSNTDNAPKITIGDQNFGNLMTQRELRLLSGIKL